MIYKIPLTQGKFAIVDKEDVLFLCQWSWYFCEGYAARKELINGKRKTILMHRVILERKLGHSDFEQVDHINRNRIDNHKDNLRSATNAQNQWNSGKLKENTSGYIGVSWHIREHKYEAYITVSGKRIYLGRFDNKKNAARARDLAAIEHFGEFVVLNFPKSDYR